MKKKVKSSFPKKLNAAAFPAQLAREEIFKSPVWIGNAPEFVEKLNKSAERRPWLHLSDDKFNWRS